MHSHERLLLVCVSVIYTYVSICVVFMFLCAVCGALTLEINAFRKEYTISEQPSSDITQKVAKL